VPSLHLKMEIDPVSETLFSSYLESQMMDKVHKPSDSECYSPSEPFRFDSYNIYLERSWLQIQRPGVRFPVLPVFLRSSGSGTGSTQPRKYN
jgi:hypothetical protein